MEDTKLAFFLYCQLPFGRLHRRTPAIIELAEILRRTPSAVAMKLTNFASIDPAITSTGRRGLQNSSKVDRAVWDVFHADWEALAGDCGQRLRAVGYRGLSKGEESSDEFDVQDFSGETRSTTIEARVSQDFFRRAVLSTYEERCCISGISDQRLLVASHIVSWSEDVANRLNPRNGLCLSVLHDRAFDRHLITLSEDLRLMVSRSLKKKRSEPLMGPAFIEREGERIAVPKRFRPDEKLLAAHRARFRERDRAEAS